jgi:hypothetical protein
MLIIPQFEIRAETDFRTVSSPFGTTNKKGGDGSRLPFSNARFATGD